METVLINLAGGQRERIWRNGREYIRAPITSIVPGVLNGSKGALLYTPDDCRASVKDWDGQPLTYFHPTRNGHNVSAHERGVKERHWIGHVENTTFNGKLRKFGMFDVQWVSKLDQKYGGDVLNKLESGEPIEMSTGLFTDNEDTAGEYNGRRFDAIARNYRPDHVAVLPGQVGACSVNDGCGVNVNKRATANALSSATLGAGHRAPSALLDLTESQRGGGSTVYEGHDGEPEQIKADDTGEDWIKKPDEPEDVEMRQQASLLHRMLTMLLGRPTGNATYSNDKKMKGYGISGQQVHDAAVSGAAPGSAPSARAGLIGDKAPQDGGRDADRLTKKPHGIQIGDAHDAADEQSDATDDSDLTVVGKRNTALGADGKTMSDEATALDDNCSTYMRNEDGEMDDEETTANMWSDEARASSLAARQASAAAKKVTESHGHLPGSVLHPNAANHANSALDIAKHVEEIKDQGRTTGLLRQISHTAAIEQHERAADVHRSLGEHKAVAAHMKAAILHQKALTLNQSPVNEDRKMKPFKIATNEDRDKALAVLNEGCKCSKEKSAFPLLNNATLEVLVANKLTKNEKAQGSNADASGSGAFSNAFDTGRDDGDSGDGAETTEDEDDYLKGKKQDPNRDIPQTPPLKNQRRLTRDEWMRIAPPEIAEATVNQLRREEKQKRAIAARLTSHIGNADQRKRIVANLLRKSLDELEDELVLHARPEVAVQDPFDGTRRASFLGATGGYSEPTGNRQSDDADDVLETLTINLGLPVEEFNKAVDAHARRGGAAA